MAEEVAVAVIRNAGTVDVLHDEVRAAIGGGAGVEDFGDARVVHAGEGLALDFESFEDFGAMEVVFDDFDGDEAVEGALLPGQINEAHAALTKEPNRAVGAEIQVGRKVRIGGSRGTGGSGGDGRQFGDRMGEEVVIEGMCPEPAEFGGEFGVIEAGQDLLAIGERQSHALLEQLAYAIPLFRRHFWIRGGVDGGAKCGP